MLLGYIHFYKEQAVYKFSDYSHNEIQNRTKIFVSILTILNIPIAAITWVAEKCVSSSFKEKASVFLSVPFFLFEVWAYTKIITWVFYKWKRKRVSPEY
jgi:hypothetical protein